MRIKEYLIDKKHLILFYFVLMFFISAVIFLDVSVKVSLDNIFYINGVSLIFFITYLVINYLKSKKYYSDINYIINNQQEDILSSIPIPKTNEQRIYYELIKKIYDEQNVKINKLYEEKKDNLEFITSWVHEVKTPISVSRLVIQSSDSKNIDEVLSSIEDEIDKIDNYVEQALYYSRIDSFSEDYFINELNLQKLMKELVKKHAKTFISKRIGIELGELDENISSDKKWLLFIIDQVMSNSLKYTKEGGKINISLEKDVKEKRLIIKDNGIGIKSEDIERVFDKGFTGFNGREYTKSTGMGLYLAKKLARKLGHDISIESVYGEYTKVTIHFPKIGTYFNL